MESPTTNRRYKDSVFRMYLSNPVYLADIHQLLTDIPTSPADIKINTLKHVFFSLEKNDISYLVNNRYMVLTEGQSTLNQNMPLRMLFYVTLLYRKLLKRRDLFQENRITIPMPEFYELYCGTKEQPPIVKLRLSDAFPKGAVLAAPLELVVTRYNIGYNEDTEQNKLLQYKPINDYSYFIHNMRQRHKAGESAREALLNTIDYCIENNIMKDFLIEHRKEVMDMYSLRWNEKAALEAAVEDGRIYERIDTALDMLRDNEPMEKIIKYSHLPEDRILELAQELHQ